MKTYQTHAGPGHQDDFLAACLLLASGHQVIRNNEPQPDTILFDMGGGDLDHHQLSYAGAGICSLHLVAGHLGVKLIGPWADVVGQLDCGFDTLRKPLNPAAWGSHPIIRFFLDRWSTCERPTGDLLTCMTIMGRTMIKAGDLATKGLAAVQQRPIIRYKIDDGLPIQCFDLRGLTMDQTVLVPTNEWRITDGREPNTVNLLAPEGHRIAYCNNATYIHPARFMAVLPSNVIV